MSVAGKNLGIKPPIVSTVLPLGATMSMDGTAMYMAILSMFAVQDFGVVLTHADYLLLGITTVTVALGPAPITSSSLFLLTAVLTGVGMSPDQAAVLVGLIRPLASWEGRRVGEEWGRTSRSRWRCETSQTK